MLKPTVRSLTEPELGTLLDWAAVEGWNPGLDDAAAFHAADPRGFLGVFADDVLVSALSAIRYEPDFGFVGLYICRPDERGKGLGKAVWKAGLARLAGRSLGLDGVVAQQANYAREGFVLAHRNVRYQGTALHLAPSASPNPGIALVELGADAPAGLIDAVLAYDRRHFPGFRGAFLRAWLKPRRRRTVVCLRDGSVAGYGTVRACRIGYKIGPLFAASEPIAALIFTALVSNLGAAQVAIDIPEPNVSATRLVERSGLQPVFETARMYRGKVLPVPLAEVFGITTFELG
jgi:hypothetical protein